MTVGWLVSVLFAWQYPSILAVFNPFLAPISKDVQERRLHTALWTSYLTGLLRDIILSSPRLGILGFSSLLTTAVTYRLCRFFSMEGWQGSFVVAVLAIIEFFFDTLFCFMVGRSDSSSFASVWSWKSFVLFVVFGCLWACALGLLGIAIRWCRNRLLRRSSS